MNEFETIKPFTVRSALLNTNPSPSSSKIAARVLQIKDDAQLLGMDESHYMDARQLAYFKEKLTAVADRLVAHTSALAEDVVESGDVADPVDRASHEESRVALLSAHARDVDQLAAVRRAILRIDAGEFGWCNESGEPIGLKRLLAQPTATLSLDAQARLEAKKKYFKN